MGKKLLFLALLNNFDPFRLLIRLFGHLAQQLQPKRLGLMVLGVPILHAKRHIPMPFLPLHVTFVNRVHNRIVRIVKVQPPKLLQELGLVAGILLLLPLLSLISKPALEHTLLYRPFEIPHQDPNLLGFLVEI